MLKFRGAFPKINFTLLSREWSRQPLWVLLAFISALLPHYLEVLGLLSLIPVIQAGESKPLELHWGNLGGLSIQWSLYTWLLVMALMFSLQMLANVLRCWSGQRLAENIAIQRRSELFSAMFEQGYLRLVQLDKGQVGQMFLREVEAIGKGVLSVVNILAGTCFVATVMLLLLCWSWGLTLMLLPFAIAVGLVMHFCNRYVRHWGEKSLDAQRHTASFLVETWQNISTLLTFRSESSRCKAFDRVIHEQRHWDQRRETLYYISLHLSRYVIFIMLVLLLYLHSQLPQHLWMGASELVVFLLVLSRLQPVLSTVSADFSNVVLGALAETNLKKLEQQPALCPVPKGRQHLVLKVGIEIKNLSFTYPSKHQPVFQKLAGHLKTRSLNVIHGPSGCGKSTLLHLLAKLHAGYQGEILVDGIEYAKLDLADFTSKVALVPQEGDFFMLSVQDNLLFGQDESGEGLFENGEAQKTQEIWEVAQLCGLKEGLQALPEGLKTPMLSAGKNFSGGQKKRLAIMRALLRHPAILLLDEPTAGLDESATLGLLDLLKNLSRTMMLVVVSHDALLIQNADYGLDMGPSGIPLS